MEESSSDDAEEADAGGEGDESGESDEEDFSKEGRATRRAGEFGGKGNCSVFSKSRIGLAIVGFWAVAATESTPI